MTTTHVQPVDIHLPQEAIDSILTEIGNRKISNASILTILPQLMVFSSSYRNLSGVQKKALVLAGLDKLIEVAIEDQAEEDALKMFVRLFAPAIIDLLCKVDYREIVINGKKKLKKCCH